MSGRHEYMGESIGNISRLAPCIFAARQTKVENKSVTFSRLLSHKMGVVDEEYVRKSNDPRAIVGRKVNINANEVRALVQIISKLGRHMSNAIGRIGL